MRCTGYFYREERVFLAIFPDDGLIGLNGRTSEKGESRRCVLKYDRAILGMNAVFHVFLNISFCQSLNLAVTTWSKVNGILLKTAKNKVNLRFKLCQGGLRELRSEFWVLGLRLWIGGYSIQEKHL